MTGRQTILRRFADQLAVFQESRDAFTIFTQLAAGSTAASSRRRPPRTLIVLDSSFNPPTLAHMRMATSAIRSQHDKNRSSGSKSSTEDTVGLLLLLAVNNADKAPKPAGFPLRMEMMRLFALDLLREINGSEAEEAATAAVGIGNEEVPSTGGSSASPGQATSGKPLLAQVDVGLTTMPYFHDKSAAIAGSGHYTDGETGEQSEQVILAGYDTLIRIFNPKYYVDAGGIRASLDPFFGSSRLRITMRADDEWGGPEEQVAYFQGLGDGALEGMGGRADWCDKVELVEGIGGDAVSSTKVRQAAREKDAETLAGLVSPRIKDFVLEEDLYDENS